jgi:hypothetical protein
MVEYLMVIFDIIVNIVIVGSLKGPAMEIVVQYLIPEILILFSGDSASPPNPTGIGGVRADH